MKQSRVADFVELDQSLPTRERELKRRLREGALDERVSLPTRERELKLRLAVVGVMVEGSLPTRERELKLRSRRWW